MKRHKIAIIGLGNELLADEGVGIHAVRLLSRKVEEKKLAVDVIAGGTPGYQLIHEFDDREKIIFIDAGNCGLEPGRFIRFSPDEVVSHKAVKGYSLHEFDLIQFLEFAGSIGKTRQRNIVIYCVQPDQIKMADVLSPTLRKVLPFLVEKVYNEAAVGINNA